MPILQAPNQQQQQGTGFTNLQTILNANKNNQLGSTVAGGIENTAGKASGDVSSAENQFNTQAGTETNRLGQEKNLVSNVLTDPTKATADDISQFQQIRSGYSNAPTGLANSDQLQQSSNQAQNLGAQINNEAGRYGLLQRYIGQNNPMYTPGQQQLDNMLLNKTGGDQLQQARIQTAGLGQQTARDISSAAQQGQALQGQAKQLGADTVSQLGTAVKSYDEQMQENLQNQQAARDAAIQSVNGPNSNAPVTLDSKTLQQLSDATNGLLGQGSNLYNVDLSKYITANTDYANKQAVQSQADFAKAYALSQLSGADLNPAVGGILQSYVGNPNMVGQYAASNPFNVSSLPDLNSAIQAQKTAYTGKTNAINAAISQANANLYGSAPAVSGGGNPMGSAAQLLQSYASALGEKGNLISGANTIDSKQAPILSQLENILNSNQYGAKAYTSLQPQLKAAENYYSNPANSPQSLKMGLLPGVLQNQKLIPTEQANQIALNKQFNVLRTLQAPNATTV